MQPTATDEKLMSRDELIAAIFSEEARPCVRTWETWKKRRIIPAVKIGRLFFYSPSAVRAALAERFTINGGRLASLNRSTVRA